MPLPALSKLFAGVSSRLGGVGRVGTELASGMPAKQALSPEGAPWAALGGLFVGEQVAYPLARGGYRSLAGAGRRDLLAEIEEEERAHKVDIAQRLAQSRWTKSLALNAARLAAADPDLYNQIMAGRRLPQGAVVLGGSPRVDLLEELAASMTAGTIQDANPSEQDLLEQLLQ